MAARQRPVLPWCARWSHGGWRSVFSSPFRRCSAWPLTKRPHSRWRTQARRPNCLAASPWRRARPGKHARSPFRKDASSRTSPAQNNPGRRSPEAADWCAASIIKEPTGRRKLPAPVVVANQTIARRNSVSASIVLISSDSFSYVPLRGDQTGGSRVRIRCRRHRARYR